MVFTPPIHHNTLALVEEKVLEEPQIDFDGLKSEWLGSKRRNLLNTDRATHSYLETRGWFQSDISQNRIMGSLNFLLGYLDRSLDSHIGECAGIISTGIISITQIARHYDCRYDSVGTWRYVSVTHSLRCKQMENLDYYHYPLSYSLSTWCPAPVLMHSFSIWGHSWEEHNLR